MQLAKEENLYNALGIYVTPGNLYDNRGVKGGGRVPSLVALARFVAFVILKDNFAYSFPMLVRHTGFAERRIISLVRRARSRLTYDTLLTKVYDRTLEQIRGNYV